MSLQSRRPFPSILPTTPSRIPHLLTAIAAKQRPRLPLPASSLLQTPTRRYAFTVVPRAPPPLRLPTKAFTRNETSEENNENNTTTKNIPAMLVITGTFAFTLATYLSYVWVSHRNALARFEQTATARELVQGGDVSSRYDDLGRDFDDEVGISEWVMGIQRMRGRIVKEAVGRGGQVLEAGCGTGRNVSYFDLEVEGRRALPEARRKGKAVEGIVFNDKSRYMVSVAERKYNDRMEGLRKRRSKDGSRKEVPVEFVVGDAGVRGVIPRPDGGFDTIVQTMGICSITNPVGYLQTLGTLLRRPDPAKLNSQQQQDNGYGKVEAPDDDGGGRIFLLEHGRGHYGWLNRYLDNGAKMHADRFGCWWNKDIGEVVKEVERLGDLKVVRIRRYHFGTTWEVELRPVVKAN